MRPGVVISTFLSILGALNLTEANADENNAGCSILINGGLAKFQPLILWPGAPARFAYPQNTETGSIVLAEGEFLRLVCLGEENALDFATPSPVSDVNVICVQGATFSFDGYGVNEEFEKIKCRDYPSHTARRTGVACPNGEVIEIGFDFGDDGFVTTITLCHDEVNQNTILAHAKIPAVIDSAQKSIRRPLFVQGNFYIGVSMDHIYTRKNQRATLAKIVGSDELALEYVPSSGSYYLAKGHLAAKTDFIYGSHQRSTFYYVNTVPMWQNVNAGNWGTLEGDLKKLAINRNIDLDVWTGSMGVLTLPDNNGVQQEVYLSVDENDRKSVPVPKLLFKVVYEANSGKGAVFLTANNPYLETLTPDYLVCTNICDSITYLTWNVGTSANGLSYCCEVDDFRGAFDGIPEFDTTGILQ